MPLSIEFREWKCKVAWLEWIARLVDLRGLDGALDRFDRFGVLGSFRWIDKYAAGRVI